MDEVIGKIIAALIVSLGGVLLSNIKSDDVVDKIMRSINHCEKILGVHLNEQIQKTYQVIEKSISSEFNRIIAMLVNPNKNFTVKQTEIEIEKPIIKDDTILFLKRIYSGISRLDNASKRIHLYKIIFGIILSVAMLFSSLYILNIFKIHESFLAIYIVITFIFILVYLFDRILISHLIKNIAKDYGLS